MSLDKWIKKVKRKGKKKSREIKDKPLHNENPHIKHSKGPEYEPKSERRY